MLRSLWIAVTVGLLLSGVALSATVETPEALVVLHSSEHHGHALAIEQPGKPSVGGLARRAGLVDQVRRGRDRAHLLLLDSGDILIGTALSSFFRGEPDILAMNAMGYHAMAAGNHEFDYGLDHLRRLQQLAKFPILCSNLSAPTTELPCQPSTLVQLGPVRIGILGLLGRHNFPDTFNREVARLLELRDPIQTARQTARALRADGAALVIALTHQDTDEDLVLLNEVPEVDVIVGGHTVGFDGLWTPGSAAPRPSATEPRSVFVKTHREGRTLGRLDLHLIPDEAANGKMRIGSAQARNLPVNDTIAPDAGVTSVLDRYAGKLEQLSGRIVGQSLVILDGEVEHIRTRETNLGNLLADLLRAEFGTDVALINGGQIRDSIPPGPVDLRRVLRVLPFPSSTVTFSVSGRQLREAMEHSGSLLPTTAGRFLQISGLSVVYDLSAPAGSRVKELRVGNRPVEDQRRYTVATDAFLADGGDGYTMFVAAEDRIDRQLPIRDLLLEALAAGPLKASVSGRIKIAK